MCVFPERWRGRSIPTDKLPKYYIKDGKKYETKTNKQIKMKDKIGKSPLTGHEDSCYITPLNETYNSYKCLVSGFESSDYFKESEGFDFDKYEETLPELYKEIKQIDSEGRVWYPTVIKDDIKGIVFVNGTSKDDWGWSSIKNILVSEEEKERFKNPKTGEYIKYKSDPSTLQQFTKFEFIEALDSLGLL